MNSSQNYVWRIAKRFFNALPDKTDETAIVEQISDGVTFRGANLWVLIFAIFIACLGLNLNSTAVIIGAMLISPLMGPIIGMGLAVGRADLELLKRSLTNYGVSTVISVLTAALYFQLTPLTEAQSELLARTSPTLYDVLIALFGGAAGILALSTGGKGNVIPGVAIATALMPPLCTAGYGLAMGEWSFFFGACYLFFINTVFIALATYVGVRLLQFKPKQFVDKARLAVVNRYIAVIVVVTMLPAVYMTTQIIRQSVLATESAGHAHSLRTGRPRNENPQRGGFWSGPAERNDRSGASALGRLSVGRLPTECDSRRTVRQFALGAQQCRHATKSFGAGSATTGLANGARGAARTRNRRLSPTRCIGSRNRW